MPDGQRALSPYQTNKQTRSLLQSFNNRIQNWGNDTLLYVFLKGVGEPPICASAAVILAIKEAIMFYRLDNYGWKNWFSLEPPCTANKICQMANNESLKVDPIMNNVIEM